MGGWIPRGNGGTCTFKSKIYNRMYTCSSVPSAGWCILSSGIGSSSSQNDKKRKHIQYNLVNQDISQSNTMHLEQ